VAVRYAEKRFDNQRAAANQRGIPFRLTFEEWLTWWKETGHAHEYGLYVMARHGDQGAYELGNIDCIPVWQNSFDGNIGATKNAWEPTEDHVVLNEEDDEFVAVALGRTVHAVRTRRHRLTSKVTSKMRMPSEERQRRAEQAAYQKTTKMA
jgi:hypothetical protein